VTFRVLPAALRVAGPDLAKPAPAR
jgi:hypothetical protein